MFNQHERWGTTKAYLVEVVEYEDQEERMRPPPSKRVYKLQKAI